MLYTYLYFFFTLITGDFSLAERYFMWSKVSIVSFNFICDFLTGKRYYRHFEIRLQALTTTDRLPVPPGKWPLSETGTSSAATPQPTASVPCAPTLCGEQLEQGRGKGCPWGAQDLPSGGEEMGCCCCSWAVMCSDQNPLSVCQECACLWILHPLSFLCFLQGLSDSFQTLFVGFFSHASMVHITDQNYFWYRRQANPFICTYDQSRH